MFDGEGLSLKGGDLEGGYCVVFGNEGFGIRDEVARVCDKKVKIRMSEEVDSLSIAIAAGIFCNGLVEREK